MERKIETMDNIETRMSRVESALDDIKTLLMNNRAFHENQGYADDEEADPPPVLIDNRLTKVQSEKVRDVLANFDFKKVNKVMKFLNWSWMNGIPDLDELKAEAKRLLIDACVEKTCIATGGFRAVYDNKNEDGSIDDEDPYVGLEFIIEDCEGFDEPEEP